MENCKYGARYKSSEHSQCFHTSSQRDLISIQPFCKFYPIIRNGLLILVLLFREAHH
jgi:hypothetical protein